MATTYSDTAYPARSNSALYWGIGIAVVLALIIYFATRGDSDRMQASPGTSTSSGVSNPDTTSGVTTGTTPSATTGTTGSANMGTTDTGSATGTNSAIPNNVGAGSNSQGNYNGQSGQTNQPTTNSGSGQGRQ